MRGFYQSSSQMLDAIRNCPRPVIAAVNGAAAGGGNELVMACVRGGPAGERCGGGSPDARRTEHIR